MKKLTYSIDGINNFHNVGPVTVHISDCRKVRGYTDRDYYPISHRVAKRVQKHFCRHADCQCAAGGIIIDLNERGDKGILAID